MRTCLLLLLLSLFGANTNAQNIERKLRFPAWTFQQKNVTIYGISAGLITADDPGVPRNVRSNGIRIEPLGLGLLLGFMGKDPLAQTDEEYQQKMSAPLSERINGLNLSPSGTLCLDCAINGISAGIIGQIGRQVNGVTVSMLNLFQSHNGLQIGVSNDAYSMNGIQMAMFNNSANAKGLQISFLNNSAEKINGLQISIFNHTEQLKGIQIGFWNVNQKRKLPLINWNFK